jgi:ABC-2 type transport system ATP-binding protein
MTNIKVVGLRKQFGDIQALDNVSFEIEENEIVGFVGANGAGKTTAMRIIMGVLETDEGEVFYNDELITDNERRAIGYMPSERGLYPKMKVKEQLVYLAKLHGLKKKDATAEVDKWLKVLNVEQYADKLLKTLSTGNAQRVQLASALVFRPRVLILDEPFSGLDPIAVQNMSETIRSLKNEGVSVLFSSHQLELIDELCDKVVIIQQGKIVQNGSPEELRKIANAPATIEVPTPLATIYSELLLESEK